MLAAGLMVSAIAATAQADIAGEAGYQQNCSACHMANGQGIPGAFPALAGNSLVAGDAAEVLRVVVYGRAGMPAFGDELSPDALAAIVTYIREHFNATSTRLTADDIAAVKVASTAKMARED
ncbi:cytochrome c [uncultured Halomonas sp.]|uniref:c-type cytochrome n=1 Tax=uncultured Halomonas sp. TaxID=173971 RepID=UPI00260E02AC|nr:cytochrome c [uncultured Halomonas sp.]